MLGSANQKSANEKRSALVIGSTGLTAQHLIELLFNSPKYQTVYGLQRRSTEISSHYTSVVCDFDQLSEYSMCFEVDDVFCCLGTTQRAAGSRETFKRIDVDYVVSCGELAAKGNAKNFVVISATNADANSLWFYNRMKGEMEQQLQQYFKNSDSTLHICRPSLLIGKRDDKRLGEQLAQSIFGRLPFIWHGPLTKYRPIKAAQLASAMVKLTATHFNHKINIHENDQLIKLANTSAAHADSR
ncbi:NAD-dependent epimerase/dehydratase family protein [Thalassotalea fusca]